MNELPVPGFQHAIREAHGARSRFTGRIRVVENFGREEVWRGEVLVFELEGHPTASRCYAWEVDGQVTAVLEGGPVKSAPDAVQASILADGED
jgi:hypothetical protein